MKNNKVKEAAPRYAPSLTSEEYLDWERKQEFKHEYHDGEIIAMAGASLKHNHINTNMVVSIGRHLHNSYCHVFSNDLRLEVSAANAYYYPDIMIVCGDTTPTVNNQDTIRDPAVIIEILSPSTRETDLNRKKTVYLTLPSLQEYIMVDSTAIWTRCMRKNKAGRWDTAVLSHPGDLLSIQTTGQHIPLQEIYAKTGL